MYTLKEAPQEMEGMEGNNLVADHLLGANSSGIAITGKPGSMQDPEVFKALDKLDTWAERSPAVTSSLSPSDLIRDMHRAFNGGSVKYDRIPDDRGLISQYLALLDPPTRTDFLTDDYAKTHLRVMCRDVGSHRWRHEIFEPMRKMALELFKGFKVEFPGYMRAVEGGSLLAVQQLIVGFLIAFGAIAILVGVAFRSARMALLSLLPNLLPTMAAMAGVVAAGQSLRVTTVLFLSVAVGITYDNTIHLYAGVRERLAGGMDHVQALRDTLEEVGPAIVFTSLLITGGLGIFMLSRVTWLVMMGLSSALVVLVAAVSDLLLTNALLGQWGHWLAPRARRR